MNPFRKIHDYFSEKSSKQRVLLIVCFALLAVFAFFFIKGNFFDNRNEAHDETSVSDTQHSDESGDNSGSNSQTQQEDVKFHINPIDILILLAIIIIFVIHKIRERIKRRRM